MLLQNAKATQLLLTVARGAQKKEFIAAKKDSGTSKAAGNKQSEDIAEPDDDKGASRKGLATRQASKQGKRKVKSKSKQRNKAKETVEEDRDDADDEGEGLDDDAEYEVSLTLCVLFCRFCS